MFPLLYCQGDELTRICPHDSFPSMIIRRRLPIPLAVIFVAVSACMSSCSGRLIVFAVDQYWLSSGYFTEKRTAELEKAALRQGARLEIAEIEYERGKENIFGDVTALDEADILLLSPLLSAVLSEGEDELPHPNTAGIFLGESSSRIGGIVLDREEAFRELGEEVCGYMAEHGNSELAGLWYIGDEEHRREYEAFTESFSGSCGPGRIRIQTLETLTTGNMEQHLQKLIIEEDSIGMAFAGKGNEGIIEKFLEKGIGFAGEYLLPEEYPEIRPFYTIVFPLEEIIEAVLDTELKTGEIIAVPALLLKRE